MKKSIVLFGWILIMMSCSPESDCYDPVLEANHSGNCAYIYNPVCGCDDNDYDNPCFAEAHGISSYTLGKCD